MKKQLLDKRKEYLNDARNCTVKDQAMTRVQKLYRSTTVSYV